MAKSKSKQARVVVPKWSIQQDRFARGKKYPKCIGTFPDCPKEITKELIDTCRTCPFR